jgi:hypothetical protein
MKPKPIPIITKTIITIAFFYKKLNTSKIPVFIFSKKNLLENLKQVYFLIFLILGYVCTHKKFNLR